MSSKPRSFALVLLVVSLASLGAFAADEVRLGAEVALFPVNDPGPAAGDQEAPAVASNGRDFLAVWVDRRGQIEGIEGALYASRLGLDGRPIDLFGEKVVAAARYPHLASAGDDYLAGYYTPEGSFTQRIDENGRAIGAPRKHTSANAVAGIASAASTYLLLETPLNSWSVTTAKILDRDGAVLQTVDGSFGRLIWVGAHDGRYVIIDVPGGCDNGCRNAPVLRVITRMAGGVWRVTSSVTLPFRNEQDGVFLGAVASSDRVLVTFHGSTAVPTRYMLADYDGNVIQPPAVLPGSAWQSTAAWDGREFLVASGYPHLQAWRISRDGAMLGNAFPLISEYAPLPRFASNGTRQILVWPDRRFGVLQDVLSRTAASFDELASTEESATLVSYSPGTQIDVHLASPRFAVWTTSRNALEGSFDGAHLVVAPESATYRRVPAAAAGGRSYLVTWFDIDQSQYPQHVRLVAKRIGFDGTPLDSEPVELLAQQREWWNMPAVTHDGKDFIVVALTSALNVIRVGEDGAVLDRRTVQTGASWPTAIAVDSDVLIPYARREHAFGCDICPPKWDIAVERVSTTGTAPAPPVIDRAAESDSLHLVAAAARGRITLAWLTRRAGQWVIEGAQILPDGTLASAPQRLLDVPNALPGSFALAWNGSEYVLAWIEHSRLRAIRMTDRMILLDREPFDVAAGVPRYVGLSIAPSPAGVVFGYPRIDESKGNVLRGFTRTLDRLPPPVRRRATRH